MTARGVIPPHERERLRAAASNVNNAVAELKAAVQAAWRAGGSVRVIAEELGKSTRTIQTWLDDARQGPPAPAVRSPAGEPD